MKKINLLFLFAVALINVKAGIVTLIPDNGELRGKIKNKETGEALPFASIAIMNGENIVTAITSEEDGNYKIKPIQSGTYTIKATYVGYKSTTINEVIIAVNKITFLDIELSNDNTLPPIVISYAPSMINVGEVSDMSIITSVDIANSASRDIRDWVSAVPGIVQTEEGGSLNIRGSRSSDTQYIVDGIKVSEGFHISKSAIAHITVITGGIPAQFGDATGGIIIITTKNYISR